MWVGNRYNETSDIYVSRVQRYRWGTRIVLLSL